MRLLIVTRDPYPPFRVDLTELFSRWLTPRFSIDWVMARSAAGPAAAIQGAPGERFIICGPHRRSWLALQLRQGIRVARGAVDLAQVRDAAFSALFFLTMARIGRRPFVFWMSYPMAEGYRHRALRQTPARAPLLRLARLAYATLAEATLYRLVLPRTDHVFVQSVRMKADVAAKGIAAHKITAVPMGVSVGVYNPHMITPVDDPRLRGRRVLVYMGSIDPERHIEMLVDVLALLVRSGFDVVLTLVGAAEGEDRARLERGAEDQAVSERLLCVGHLPLMEALAYVRRADVCLATFPTWPKTYLSATPTKLVEYLAMGRPVVANDHPDQRQVIAESGAGVIAPGTAEGFADAIAALFNDPAEAEAMGAKGPPWIAAHRDYGVISGAVAAVYDRLLQHRAAP